MVRNQNLIHSWHSDTQHTHTISGESVNHSWRNLAICQRIHRQTDRQTDRSLQVPNREHSSIIIAIVVVIAIVTAIDKSMLHQIAYLAGDTPAIFVYVTDDDVVKTGVRNHQRAVATAHTPVSTHTRTHARTHTRTRAHAHAHTQRVDIVAYVSKKMSGFSPQPCFS